MGPVRLPWDHWPKGMPPRLHTGHGPLPKASKGACSSQAPIVSSTPTARSRPWTGPLCTALVLCAWHTACADFLFVWDLCRQRGPGKGGTHACGWCRAATDGHRVQLGPCSWSPVRNAGAAASTGLFGILLRAVPVYLLRGGVRICWVRCTSPRPFFVLCQGQPSVKTWLGGWIRSGFYAFCRNCGRNSK